MGKKGKKSKGKSLSLGEFLGSSNANSSSSIVVSTKSSWAEESEDFEEDRYAGPAERIVLPTAPRQARGPAVDLERVPTQPPFIAFVANLPFEVEEEDIKRFFQNLAVANIRLPRDGGENGRFKGYAYVEFENRTDLLEALAMNDDMMRNRKIRVDIAEEDNNRKNQMNHRGGDRDEDREDRSGGVSDWRAAPRESGPPRGDRSPDRRFEDRDRGNYGDRDRNFGRDRDRFDSRGGGGGYRDERDRDRNRGYDRDYNRGGGSRFGGGGGGRFDDNDRRGGGGYDDRDRRGGGGYDDRRGGGGYDDRRGGGGYDDRDRRGGGGYDDRRGGGGGYGRRSTDDYERKDDDRWKSRGGGSRDDDKDQVKERPRLNLKPRTKAVEETENKPVVASASIFGSAKPVDTASKDKEIANKYKKETPSETTPPKKEAPVAAAVDIFGAAKPVDTAAREREIEEKLKKKQDVSLRKDEKDDARAISNESKRPIGGGGSQEKRNGPKSERKEPPPAHRNQRPNSAEEEEATSLNGQKEEKATDDVINNEAKKAQKKIKILKEEADILNTANKFSQLGLEEEEV